MTDTSSNLPICVYCGTPRPADESLCPQCGKPWIDIQVANDGNGSTAAEAAGAVAAVGAVAAASPTESSAPPPDRTPLDETGEFDFDDWTLPPEKKPSRAKWLVPLLLLIAFGAVWVVIFVDRESTAPSTSVVAIDTTSTAPATTTTQASTTTTHGETTTSTPTTTTVPWPAADTWLPVGDPIPTPELALKASGIGPIALGTPIAEAAGALVSSLGQADTAGFDASICSHAELYWLTWGDLLGIFDGYSDDAEFIAYRYQNDATETPDPVLETLSGIRLGDTVETLQNTYVTYTVSFEVIDGKDHFRLSDGGDPLLWGPLSSSEPDGIVEGIYSPDPCLAGT